MAEIRKVSFGIIASFVLVIAIFLPAVQGHGHEGLAPAPAPTSDGTTIDQGIACGLMLLALVLTYLIHTFDAPLNI
ncbi:arabinogalactan peptide 22-like isoform X2 [Olea europaea var. sylvestris]|uniref:Arabinogalactan peptide 22-like n=1 Tax=Olea europaea subsp. europaea TaxID=158383 RepID=A0A8S0TKA8_OLEEU|nr:arabinogalactan peptide 22-like isoform X1 [Olea europaea var. sylvestris]XP_022881316.1 arabinogalactan peptide 22-like isoform X2 [Olea europaea var. sylvestris]CAA3006215.1 arabinogalactan peptide 22-like [Olea europaea subsp. europaea]